MKHNNIITDDIANDKVLTLKEAMSVDSLASLLGMSKTTMYKRLTTKSWKKSERALIQKL